VKNLPILLRPQSWNAQPVWINWFYWREKHWRATSQLGTFARNDQFCFFCYLHWLHFKVVNTRKTYECISGFFLSTGLAELALNKYKSAAKYFLQAQFDHFDYKEVRGRNPSQTVKVLRYVIHFLIFSWYLLTMWRSTEDCVLWLHLIARNYEPKFFPTGNLSVLNCFSWRSCKDHLLLIQCYYSRKPKLNNFIYTG
jgi:hypothetical protein